MDVSAGADRAAVNVYFHTFGCKANQYDTDVVRQAFADRGAAIVADPSLADLAVINSCTVTRESEVKAHRSRARVRRRLPPIGRAAWGRRRMASSRDGGADGLRL